MEKQETKEIKPSNRVYVRWDVTDESLKTIFAAYGKISEARVVRGPRLRAFGFITFENEAEASKAVTALNGKGVMTSPLTVEYASPERGPRKRAQRRSEASLTPPAQSQPPATAQARLRAGAPQGQSDDAGPRPRRRRNRKANIAKDPNYGKVVLLNPDPIMCPIPKDSHLIELTAGPRQYRPGFSNGKIVSSLILNADPTKGPFNCDFKLGDFELKLLSVKVNSKPDDCRIGARIMHPTTNRSREVYLRVRTNGENRHKFFELMKTGADQNADPCEVFFVGLDSILLDTNTGLWKKIVLSLVSCVVSRRIPQVPPAAGQ